MSVTGISANRLELLQIADAVAREKSIEKEIVMLVRDKLGPVAAFKLAMRLGSAHHCCPSKPL